jgi:hypothetical protein
MTLFLATLFVALVAMFGVLLMFARPENIERPFMVGGFTVATAGISSWLMWLEWQSSGAANHGGTAVAFALFAASGFALGRAIDQIMGPMAHSADERQATLGAELAD